MLSENTTRWTVTVSKETDVAVRTLLAQRGMKKGDLSRFIEDAVKWRVLDQTLAESRAAFSIYHPMICRHLSMRPLRVFEMS
jgi:hypothetical protein